MVPDATALAFISAAQLLVSTRSAVDCSEPFLRSKLHPTSFVGVEAPDAAEEAGKIRRIAILVLVVFLPPLVAVVVLGNAPLPPHGGPACNVCLPVQGEELLSFCTFIACLVASICALTTFGLAPTFCLMTASAISSSSSLVVSQKAEMAG